MSSSRPEVHFATTSASSGPAPAPPALFAPKYLVGNVLAGDAAAEQNLDGFMFIPDPGDGTGLAMAFTAPNGVGDVWVRPGLYDLSTGAVAVPMIVPAGMTVRGAGQSTIIRAHTDAGSGQGVFTLLAGAELHSMRVVAPQPPQPTGGPTALISLAGDDAAVFDVVASINPNVGDALQAVVQVQPSLRARIIGCALSGLNANSGGAIVDIAGSQVVCSSNTIEAQNGDFCIRQTANHSYLAGNVLNAHGGTQISDLGLNNTDAPNVLL